MVAAVAVAPVVQAFTVQRTCLPRSLLACAAVTWTQRLAFVVLGVALGDAVAVVVGSVEVEADGSGVAVVDVEGSGVAVVDVAVDVAVDVDGPRSAGAVAAVGEVAEDAGLEAVGVGVVGLAVGVGVVPVGVGVVEGDVALGVAEGLGDATGSCSGSHDCLPAVAAAVVAAAVVAAAAVLAAAAKLTPETAANRALPATRATEAGRGCANRMKTPADAARYCSKRLTRLRHSLPDWLGSSRPGTGQPALSERG
jgi:hypothetical protein